MNHLSDRSRILGIDPIRRGFAYAVIETPNRLIDWGTHRSKTDEGILRRFEDVLTRLLPHVIVIEDFEAWPESSPRIHAREFLNGVRLIAFLQSIPLERLSREKVHAALGAETKHEIAAAIAVRLPELFPRLPRPRKPWTSEAPSMNIFDACSLALTVLAEEADA